MVYSLSLPPLPDTDFRDTGDAERADPLGLRLREPLFDLERDRDLLTLLDLDLDLETDFDLDRDRLLLLDWRPSEPEREPLLERDLDGDTPFLEPLGDLDLEPLFLEFDLDLGFDPLLREPLLDLDREPLLREPDLDLDLLLADPDLDPDAERLLDLETLLDLDPETDRDRERDRERDGDREREAERERELLLERLPDFDLERDLEREAREPSESDAICLLLRGWFSLPLSPPLAILRPPVSLSDSLVEIVSFDLTSLPLRVSTAPLRDLSFLVLAFLLPRLRFG